MTPRLILAIALGLILSTTLPARPAGAADCGDAAGPGGTRVPCACGDDVVTDTVLRASDPVVSSGPGDFCVGVGLYVSAPGITLNCRGYTLRGDFSDDGIYVVENGTTVQGCVVTEFWGFAAIHVDAGFTTVVNNKAFYNAEAGIALHYETDNRADRNQLEWNGCGGLIISFSNDNSVGNTNRVTSNGCVGIGVDYESTGNVLTANITDANFGSGIVVLEAGNVLDANRGKNNLDDGIFVAVPGNTLKKNVYDRNGLQGICAVAGNTDAGGNRGTGNGLLPDVDFDC